MNDYIKNSYYRKQNGFSLIESLVAISILLLALVGPLTIASRGVFSSNVARDQITAFYLAQEAVEHVRNLRDKNALQGASWLSGLLDCSAPNFCRIDAKNNTVAACSGNCPQLLVDSSRFYNYLSGTPTTFRRNVQITTLNDHEAAVSVRISWQTGVIPRTFTVRENILNWQ